jgi:hypothetical protein
MESRLVVVEVENLMATPIIRTLVVVGVKEHVNRSVPVVDAGLRRCKWAYRDHCPAGDGQ